MATTFGINRREISLNQYRYSVCLSNIRLSTSTANVTGNMFWFIHLNIMSLEHVLKGRGGIDSETEEVLAEFDFLSTHTSNEHEGGAGGRKGDPSWRPGSFSYFT